MSRKSPAAAAAMAGFMIQLHRALHHLAISSDGDLIGVETADDVVVAHRDGSKTFEQDKLTLDPPARPLTDRSDALWRTLENWFNAWDNRKPGIEARFFLSTNREVEGSAAQLLKKNNRSAEENETILSLLKAQHRPSPESHIQETINRVLHRSDEDLIAVITRTELHSNEGTLDLKLIASTKTRLPFSGIGIDDDQAYNALIGWIEITLLQKWFDQKPGWIGKSEFNRQVYAVVENLKRQHILPRAARLLPVTKAEVDKARDFRFVDHLGMIDVAGAFLDEEIIHYIRFSKEKIRLAESGDYQHEHWSDRSDRLKQHWNTIKRERCEEGAADSKAVVGRRILNDAAKIREPLAEVSMLEAYMSIGHFHRLADEDEIAWHPDFQCKE